MSDEADMRLRLQQVAAYRELIRSVRRSGRENVIFSLALLGLAYFFHTRGMAGPFLFVWGTLILGELLAGLFKWAVPVPEGFLLDALVLAAFAAFVGWIEFQNRNQPSAIFIFLALYMLYGAINKLRAYGELRRLFADRPDPEHIAWFDELVREIQASDPIADQSALDLPTRPHWKAKLLGGTAFFVAVSGNMVWVAGAEDFTLRREKTDRGTGYRKALLSIHGENYPEFELSDASWENYTKWMAAQQPAPRA
jgi:hypothetical protein